MANDLMTAARTETLRVSIKTTRMPHTTQFRRLQRGAEELYYFILFTGDRYQERNELWRLWSGAGFSTGLQAPVPGANAEDEIVVSMRSDGKHVVMSIFSGEEVAINALAELLLRIESLRPNLTSEGEEDEPGQALFSDQFIAPLLARSEEQAQAAGLRADELESMSHALRRDLTTFVHPGISSVVIGRSSNEA